MVFLWFSTNQLCVFSWNTHATGRLVAKILTAKKKVSEFCEFVEIHPSSMGDLQDPIEDGGTDSIYF